MTNFINALTDDQLTTLVQALEKQAALSATSLEDYLFNLVDVCGSDEDVASATDNLLVTIDQLDAFLAWHIEY